MHDLALRDLVDREAEVVLLKEKDVLSAVKRVTLRVTALKLILKEILALLGNNSILVI